MHANLDKIIFIKISPRYSKQNKIFKLNKVFYSLHQSILLWQQKLTDKIKKFSFEKISQKLSIVQKNDIIYFFYIDNIVFAFKKINIEKLKELRFFFQKQ